MLLDLFELQMSFLLACKIRHGWDSPGLPWEYWGGKPDADLRGFAGIVFHGITAGYSAAGLVEGIGTVRQKCRGGDIVFLLLSVCGTGGDRLFPDGLHPHRGTVLSDELSDSHFVEENHSEPGEPAATKCHAGGG